VRSAAETGHELHAALDLVGARHDSIGEVRGSGLLLGVALVGDAATRSPDPRLAHRVMNGMRERGVLVGTTGPHRNVLKLRPPLAFRSEHVALVVRALDEALEEAGPQ
jgi:4-aminobutyrate aminotransferase-like enzyme